jgi:hypothetical protein
LDAETKEILNNFDMTQERLVELNLAFVTDA